MKSCAASNVQRGSLKLKANKNGKNPRTKYNVHNMNRTKCVFFIASLAITKTF